MLLLLPLVAKAQGVKTPSEPAALARSFWTLSIQEAESGKELVGIRSHHLATPASTMKLVSTATLWSQRGDGLRIPTEIRTNGTIAQGKLEGDLYIVGQGDPSIGSRYFWNSDQDLFFKEVAKALKSKGVTQVIGNIIALSPQVTSKPITPAGLPTIWVMPTHRASGALMPTIIATPSTLPSMGRATTPPPGCLSSSYGKPTKSPLAATATLSISVFPHPDGSYDITGTYPQRVEKLRIRGALPNPPLFVAHHLQEVLKAQGIATQGEARVVHTTPAESQLLYTYQSAPLRTLVQTTLHYSHNLFAEGLLRQLTWGKTPLPGQNATQTAVNEVHRYWTSRGINTRELEMMDGSGLSPENRVSAYFLATMLGKVYRADPSGSFQSLLPRAGREGTLVQFLKGTPLQGKARLKSGTLRNVVCYAGYVEVDGKTYTIALMVNNFYGKASTVRKAMEEVLLEAFGY